MQIDSDEFLVSRPLSLKNNYIMYTVPETSLTKAWNGLSEYFIMKNQAQMEIQSRVQNISQNIAKALGLNSTLDILDDLISKGVIKTIESARGEKEHIHLKRYAVNSALEIIQTGIKCLDLGKEFEKKLSVELLQVKNVARVENNSIRIYIDPLSAMNYFISYNDAPCDIPFLHCEIRYGSYKMAGCFKPHFEFECEKASYVKYKDRYVLSFKRGKLSIETSIRTAASLENPLCTYVLQEIYSGNTPQLIYGKILVALSRYFLSELIATEKVEKVIKDDGARLCDGRPEIFFVKSQSSIYKVLRKGDNISISNNGKRIF
ncbi:hypothetical protein ENBRE01_0016 [Enteropsectra breve]|nr:hypothetical protein ENBRE01_0016 [Enteropsectra breve]